MRIVLGFLCLFALVASGCKEKKQPTAPYVPDVDTGDAGPRGGRSGGGSIPIGGRGGSDDEEDAGGTSMEELALACDDFPVVPPGSVDAMPGVFFNLASSPADFKVTRAEVAWESSCLQPTIRITLSDGDCPDGDGHELEFMIPADGIESGEVLLGQNSVVAEPVTNRITVRYRRPASLPIEPYGEWGSCTGVSGTVNLRGVDELETTDDSQFVGHFELELTRCDEGPASVQNVVGDFSVKLPSGQLEVCPED